MSRRYPEPIMGKREGTARPDSRRHYALLTWPRMLRIIRWAEWAAVEAGAPVYLVGSAARKDRPRDVDLAVVWPRAEFERLWGPLPRRQEEFSEFWRRPAYEYGKHAFNVSAWQGAGYKPYLDVHLTPDVWWEDRPRVLLGDPKAKERPTHGLEGEFYLTRMVHYTTTHPDGTLDDDGPFEVDFDWEIVRARRPGDPFVRGGGAPAALL